MSGELEAYKMSNSELCEGLGVLLNCEEDEDAIVVLTQTIAALAPSSPVEPEEADDPELIAELLKAVKVEGPLRELKVESEPVAWGVMLWSYDESKPAYVGRPRDKWCLDEVDTTKDAAELLANDYLDESRATVVPLYTRPSEGDVARELHDEGCDGQCGEKGYYCPTRRGQVVGDGAREALIAIENVIEFGVGNVCAKVREIARAALASQAKEEPGE